LFALGLSPRVGVVLVAIEVRVENGVPGGAFDRDRAIGALPPTRLVGVVLSVGAQLLAADALFFSGRRREEIDLTKLRSTQANSGL
jgi:hypothetical protein